tara:strand:+ start:773 stop:1708 length:936 start_codon:yes stop_codon:yes gene_type:complete
MSDSEILDNESLDSDSFDNEMSDSDSFDSEIFDSESVNNDNIDNIHSDIIHNDNTEVATFRNDNIEHYQKKPNDISFELPIAQLCYYYDYDKLLELEFSSKIVVPSYVLEEITKYEDISFPMVFNIKTDNNEITVTAHSFPIGIDCVYVPYIMYDNLTSDNAPVITLQYSNTKLEKATKLVLQPHLADFLDIDDHKDYLEYYINNYTIIEKNSMIVTPNESTVNNLYFNVIEVEPADKVITIDTDVEIIFKTPLNYREPPPKLISNGNGFNLQHTKSPEKDQQSSGSSTNPTKKKKKFVPFSGKGHRLGGD